MEKSGALSSETLKTRYCIIMFQGHSICNIDAKSRIILPAKFRKDMNTKAENKFYIMRGLECCLWLFTKDVWDELTADILEVNNPFDKKMRRFKRELLYLNYDVEMDSQNRILIPPELMQFANLKKEADLIGLLNMIEIWAPEERQKYIDSEEESFENVAQELSERFKKKNA